MAQPKFRSFSGVYQKKDSISHNSNTVIKLLVISVFSIIVLLEDNIYNNLLFTGIVFLLTLMTKFSKKEYIKILNTAKLFIVFTIFSALIRPTFSYWFKFYIITFSKANTLFAIALALKTLSIISLVYIFTTSTPLIDLLKKWSSSKESNVFNKRIIKFFKVDSLVMICILTLNFIPLILEEFNTIFTQYLKNKPDDKNNSITSKIKSIAQVFPAFIISVIEKVDEFSDKLTSKKDLELLDTNETSKFKDYIKLENLILLSFLILVILLKTSVL